MRKLAIIAVAAAATTVAFADFNSQDVEDAGFAAEPGQYEGKELSDEQCADLQAAIDMMMMMAKEGSPEEKCAMGLQKMKDADRICAECGSSTSTTTLPDGMEGCDGDGINIPPTRIGEKTKLMGTLCHEWVHVMQTGPYPEGPAYEAGKAWLAEAGMSEDDPYYEWYCCQVDIHNGKKKKKANQVGDGPFEAAQTTTVDTPVCGYREIEMVGEGGAVSTFTVEESTPVLTSFVGMQKHVFDLAMLSPLEMIVLPEARGPGGGRVLAVSGISGDLDGIVQYLEISVAQARVVDSLEIVTIPESDPLGLVAERIDGRHFLYVLDTHSNVVWRLEDRDGNLLPELVPALPWATTQDFPTLGLALSIQPNLAERNSVLASTQDYRVECVLRAEAPMVALFDRDANGVAEGSMELVQNEVFSVRPFPFDVPAFDATEIDVFSSNGGTIELWSCDAAGDPVALMASAVGGGDNVAEVVLADPLAAGDRLMLRDATFYPDHPSPPFRVEATDVYGQGCAAGSWTPKGVVEGSAVVDTRVSWKLAGAPPAAPAALLVGTEPAAVDMAGLGAPGCTLLTAPLARIARPTDAAGEAFVEIGIPADPDLVGTRVYGQWIAIAEGVNAMEALFSNGMSMQVAPAR